MNKYMKPAFMLTSLEVTIPATGNCDIKGEELDLVKDTIGETAFKDAFGVDENCVNVLDSYCKFTSNDGEGLKVFFS